VTRIESDNAELRQQLSAVSQELKQAKIENNQASFELIRREEEVKAAREGSLK